jgi:hypothetical protein
MRLIQVSVGDHRSVWGPPVDLRLGVAVTALVGPNLAGKSNLVRAATAALDPTLPFDLERERPRRRPDAVPTVTCVYADRHHGRPDRVEVTVSWPRGVRVVDVRPGGDHDLPAGRPVVAWATDAPGQILDRADHALDGENPRALADDLLPTLQRVLPEVAGLELTPGSAGWDVRVLDVEGFPVASQTVRATFGAAVAAHLVRRGADLPAIVVEEPEAFLHPAAQETLRDELLEIGVAADAPVLLTTESPFVLPRHPDARIVAVARDTIGRTGVVGSATGDAPHAPLLGGMFRDGGLAAVLDRTGAIPPEAEGVVVVEGGTDEAYLRLAARVLGRESLLDRLAIHPAGGALPAALQAIVLRAETDLPLFVLLDADEAGRRAHRTLTDRFQFTNRRQVTSYAEVIPDHPQGAEAEDVFDWRLVDRFVRERGDRGIRGKRILVRDEWHFDLTASSKSAFVGWLDEHARPEHLRRWGQVLDLLAERVLA